MTSHRAVIRRLEAVAARILDAAGQTATVTPENAVGQPGGLDYLLSLAYDADPDLAVELVDAIEAARDAGVIETHHGGEQ